MMKQKIRNQKKSQQAFIIDCFIKKIYNVE